MSYLSKKNKKKNTLVLLKFRQDIFTHSLLMVALQAQDSSRHRLELSSPR